MNRQVYYYLLTTYGRLPGYWFGVVAEIISSLIIRVFGVIFVANIAGAIAARDLGHAKQQVLIYFLVSVVGNVLATAGEIVAYRAENKRYDELVVHYYRRMMAKDMSFFKDHQTGYLATTFRQHVDGGLQLVRLVRQDFIRQFVSLVAPTVVLFTYAWQIGVIAVAIIFTQLIYISWSSAKANKYREASHEIYRKITGLFSDDVLNVTAFKSSGKYQSSVARLEKLAQQEFQTFWLRRRTTALLDLPRSIVTLAAVSLAFWIVAGQASSTGGGAVSLLVLTVTYMFLIFRNVDSLPNLITRHDDFVTQVAPTLQYVNSDYETIQDRPTAKAVKMKHGAITLSNVSYSYGGGQGGTPVFKDLTLSIAAGEQVGVVGLSGAGKSTLASLLMRFDDIQSGSIMMDRVDIRDIKQASLRQQISFVPQEPLLFHRSIKENITYFKPDATQQQIERAAKAAHAHEFIRELRKGYDTLVGERGVKLSGGQKQRVVLARSILKDAPIMIFDEATSALDSESEQIIQKALPGIIGKRTAIVIAHRLSTVAGLDRIIVLEKGKIIEQGTHAQLLKKKGRYASLWQKQTNGKTI